MYFRCGSMAKPQTRCVAPGSWADPASLNALSVMVMDGTKACGKPRCCRGVRSEVEFPYEAAEEGLYVLHRLMGRRYCVWLGECRSSNDECCCARARAQVRRTSVFSAAR